MSFNSFKDVVGHVETALQFMKNSKRNSGSEDDGLAYGNNYYAGHAQHQQQQPPPHYPPPQQQNYSHPPPPPPGWIQQWDQNSQRYYYLETATGRTQWEPPAYPGHAQRQQQQWGGHDGSGSPAPYQGSPAPYQGSPAPYQHQGSPGPFHAPGRSNSNPPLSPGQIPRHDSLPPGCSYDMKTGQIVNSMLPPAGHHSAPVKYW